MTARFGTSTARVLWDTGAQYGYWLADRLPPELRKLPGFHDFSPIYTDLKAGDSYLLPVELGGHRYEERVAPAQGDLAGFLRGHGLAGILGSASLHDADFWLDPPNRRYAVGTVTS
jgi:hypothetical protein